jgi:hypothetical protein
MRAAHGVRAMLETDQKPSTGSQAFTPAEVRQIEAICINAIYRAQEEHKKEQERLNDKG